MNKRLGNLLSEGITSVAKRQGKRVAEIEQQIGEALDYTYHTIQRWKRGYPPKAPEQVAHLVRYCVTQGRVGQAWAQSVLTQAQYPHRETLLAEIFPPQPQKGTEADDETAPQVVHNLPRRPYEAFVGREQELADLRRFLSPRHRMGVVCLNGIAGVGKTALALEIAHQFLEGFAMLPPDERFTAVVYVTAKSVELLPKGPEARQPTFTDLASLYRALAEVLDLPAITRAATRAEQTVIVVRALAERPVLLILDNLEDVDDPNLMVFLRDLPAPSKAIVTTRHRVDIAVPISLRALNEAEARQLIQAECHRHSLTLTDEQAEKLLGRTGGLPLAIVRTMGRMAWRGSDVETEIRQLGDPASPIYAFCFDNSIILIRGKDPHRLFMALPLFATDASREALGYVAGFEKDVLSRDEGLSDLKILSLVNKEGNRFSLEPLTKVRAGAELAANPEFERRARERWLAWAKTLAEQAEDVASYPALRPEVDNLLGVLAWLIKQERMVEAGRYFSEIQYFLFADGQWEPLLNFAEQILTWAEAANNPDMMATVIETSVNVFRNQGAFSRGEVLLEGAQIAAARLDDERLQAEIWLAQARFLYDRGDLAESVQSATKALAVFRRQIIPEKMVIALNTLGNLYSRRQHFQEARHLYEEGLNILDNTTHNICRGSGWRATLRGNLGIIAGRQGRYAEACDILYDILDDLVEQTDLAEGYAILACYELQLERPDQARLLRKQADQIIERLNLARPICEEDAEWLRLHGQEA